MKARTQRRHNRPLAERQLPLVLPAVGDTDTGEAQSIPPRKRDLRAWDPTSTPPVDPDELGHLVQWVRERESIRRLREAGAPKPWTQDPIMQSYRWCNVRRMDDRVSQTLLQRWYPGTPAHEQLGAAALARLINWPDSLLAITGGHPYRAAHLDRALPALSARAAMNQKIFTGVYVVPGRPGECKVDSVLGLVRAIHDNQARLIAGSTKQTWANLCELPGLGSFLAGQIVADLAHLSAGSAWPDRRTWAPAGPGSVRGLNRLFGRPTHSTLRQDAFETLLAHLIRIVSPLISDICEDRQLYACDFQSIACEVDKRARLRNQEGRVRARYDGGVSSKADAPCPSQFDWLAPSDTTTLTDLRTEPFVLSQ